MRYETTSIILDWNYYCCGDATNSAATLLRTKLIPDFCRCCALFAVQLTCQLYVPEGAFGATDEDITIDVSAVPDSILRATAATTNTTDGTFWLITPTVDFTIEQAGMTFV